MNGKHLTDEALLILAGRNASPKVKKLASAHLLHCQTCRGRLDETRQVVASWTYISDQGLLHKDIFTAHTRRDTTSNHIWFPWKPVLTVLAFCAVLGAFLITSRTVPVASASSILATAAQNELKVGTPETFRMDIAGQTCARGASNVGVSSIKLSPQCAEGLSLMRQAAWPAQNPLSVHSFSAWRSSLPKKKDKVLKRSDTFTVDTSAPSGVLREASLTMTSSNYRPVSLNLVFDNDESIRFSEDAPAPVVHDAAPESRVATITPTAAGLIDPMDAQEADAWALLSQLHSDSGWEATVVRRGGELKVVSVPSSPSRDRQLQEAFQQDPQVEVQFQRSEQSADAESVLPKRVLSGDSPPLAQDWLEQQYPDVQLRSTFTNEALSQSQAIMGKAFFLDHLKQSRARMAPSQPKQELASLIVHQESLLIEDEKKLALAVAPLLGKSKRSAVEPLTYSEAQQLDSALGALLGASSSDGNTYEGAIETVRKFL